MYQPLPQKTRCSKLGTRWPEFWVRCLVIWTRDLEQGTSCPKKGVMDQGMKEQTNKNLLYLYM